MYLPLAAVVTAVVLGTICWAESAGETTADRLAAAARAEVDRLRPAGLIAATLGCVSFVRNRDYRSELSIWENTVRQCPGNGIADDNLASLWWSDVESGRASPIIGKP